MDNAAEAANERILDTLGMARRAGKLAVGQDKVLASLRRREPLLAVVTNDCSGSVLRSLNAGAARGEVRILVLKNVDRTVLGKRLGVGSAQVAALPCGGGFAEKVLSLYYGSDADEQNQSV